MDECQQGRDPYAMDDSQQGRDPYAVVVRRACVKYGSLDVLKDLDMSVRKGTIYGLLGASGCGKTTLLSCVVGRRHLDSGEVRVLGVVPGTRASGVPGARVGYMPQEMSLYNSFTIRENVVYFGLIFKMKAEDLENRLSFLSKLLELPDVDVTVSNLSGGQQRRVSFIVAILHDAELLILDEPTVGMDTMLRQVIWEYLREIAVAGNKTIIITTHYIEEARRADTIGLVRNGCLLEETSPLALLEKYNCGSLEEVFFSLSSRQDEQIRSVVSVDVHEGGSDTCSYELKDVTRKDFDSLVGDAGTVSMKQRIFATMSVSNVRALIYKNVLSMWRDVILMMYFFGQCAAAVTAFYCAFGGNPSDLPLAVVNHDVTSPSPTCQNLTPFGGCEFADLSCRYLSHINGPVLKKEFYNSTEAAQRVVGRGKAWGIVHFAENFSHSYERRLRGGFIADVELLDQGSIHAMIDMSNHVISWAVKEELYSKYQDFAHQMMTACNMNPRLGDFPIRVFEPVYGTMKVNFLYTATPGMLISLSAFLGITISVWTVVHERREGLLIRNIISGVNMFEIMLAYFLCMFVMICVQAGFIVVSAFVIYRFYNVGDLILITVFLVSEGVCGILYGFAISSFCHNDGSASHASVGSLYPLIVLSGVFWPVEALNTYLYRLSTVLPLTLPVKAMRCIMVRGWTMKDFEVQLGFLTIFAWNAVFLVICVLAFRFKKF